MAETVDVIEFSRSAGPYRANDRAGFDNPDTAEAYVKLGVARFVARGVPRVDPRVKATDAMNRIQELRDIIAVAERDAQATAKIPGSSVIAQQALDLVMQAKGQIAALQAQMDAHPLSDDGDGRRKPPASARAG